MAVLNKYVNDDVEAGKIANAAFVNGAKVVQMVATEEIGVTPTDEIASVYRFFKGISGNLIPTKIEVYGDAALVALVVDVGLYEQSVYNGDTGAVIDLDVFGDGLAVDDITTSTDAMDGMVTVDIADRQKKIYEHAGHTVATAKAGYDLCLTSATAATTGGTVTVVATFIEG
ncbi:MAG: hypothetical protein GY928_34495 [Colwellia sp.]|nr:hypothetical protein [Colwellia sp.]